MKWSASGLLLALACIAGSQITTVRLVPGSSFGPWLVVYYVEAGENRVLGLRPSATKSSVDIEQLRAAVEQLFSNSRGN